MFDQFDHNCSSDKVRISLDVFLGSFIFGLTDPFRGEQKLTKGPFNKRIKDEEQDIILNRGITVPTYFFL